MKAEWNFLGKFISLPFWTEEAVRCYERGCVCSEECDVFRIMGRNCNMKACVLESVKTLGNPKECRVRRQNKSMVN